LSSSHFWKFWDRVDHACQKLRWIYQKTKCNLNEIFFPGTGKLVSQTGRDLTRTVWYLS
jgi:hypothetical protein